MGLLRISVVEDVAEIAVEGRGAAGDGLIADLGVGLGGGIGVDEGAAGEGGALPDGFGAEPFGVAVEEGAVHAALVPVREFDHADGVSGPSIEAAAGGVGIAAGLALVAVEGFHPGFGIDFRAGGADAVVDMVPFLGDDEGVGGEIDLGEGEGWVLLLRIRAQKLAGIGLGGAVRRNEQLCGGRLRRLGGGA